MLRIKIAGVLLASALFGLPAGASAGTITVDLPGLTGSYVYSDLAAFGARKSVSVPIASLGADATSARLVISGQVTPGIVRGDGVVRAAVEPTLRGGFPIAFSYNAGGTFYMDAEIQQPIDGAFSRQREVAGPFGDVLFIDLDLAPDAFSNDLPALIGDPPEGGWYWSDGLQLVTPVTGTISEAYLVLEGPNLPEPATLSLVVAGAAVAMLRRKRRGEYRTRNSE